MLTHQWPDARDNYAKKAHGMDKPLIHLAPCSVGTKSVQHGLFRFVALADRGCRSCELYGSSPIENHQLFILSDLHPSWQSSSCSSLGRLLGEGSPHISMHLQAEISCVQSVQALPPVEKICDLQMG